MMGGVEGGGVSILEGQKDIAVIGDGVCTSVFLLMATFNDRWSLWGGQREF